MLEGYIRNGEQHIGETGKGWGRPDSFRKLQIVYYDSLMEYILKEWWKLRTKETLNQKGPCWENLDYILIMMEKIEWWWAGEWSYLILEIALW